MSFAKYLEGRRRSEAAVEKLAGAMSDLQVRMADQLVDLLLELDVKGGKVESTEANVNRVSEIMRLLKNQLADDQWIEAVADYVDSFDIMEGDIVGYMGSLGEVDERLITALRSQLLAKVPDADIDATLRALAALDAALHPDPATDV